MRRLARGLLLGLALATAGVPAHAALVQDGTLRATVLAQVEPFRLPRHTPAPIAVFLSGHLASTNGTVPPQLRRLRVEVNRHALLQSAGLPRCGLRQIQPATTQRALQQCAPALVGSGQFWAKVVLPGQAPYPTQGRILLFNGERRDKPVLYAHIYTEHPFASSFVITFAMRRIDPQAQCAGREGRRTRPGKDAGSEGRGAQPSLRDPTRATEDTARRCVRRPSPFGTELSASLPQALGSWGFVERIKMTLRRKYTYRGRSLSYFNAACPAPPGTGTTDFPLAFASFRFATTELKTTVEKACGVRGS